MLGDGFLAAVVFRIVFGKQAVDRRDKGFLAAHELCGANLPMRVAGRDGAARMHAKVPIAGAFFGRRQRGFSFVPPAPPLRQSVVVGVLAAAMKML